ncbi:MAG: 3-deoxy-7-phosphoheptulonate synthase [Nitrososphaeria archaeon]|nr:3-deoxy-7-phosphoheptulonate synthase [Nitrososphaeria archaeon]
MNLKHVLEKRDRLIEVDGITFGRKFVIIAGPCAVESKEQLLKTAKFLKENGVDILRAMIFKPRTSPYSFQGLGIEGLRIINEVKKEVKIPVVTEVVDEYSLEEVHKVSDILQIGARNMQNYILLKKVGRINKPVILKRGFGSTIEEWLCAAEYIMSEGNEKVILCERGIRTFVTETRFTLDLASVPIVKELTSIPVIVDPSHAAGSRKLVIPLARASKAVGCDGIMVEVHPEPDKALSDGKQQLNFEMFKQMMCELK